jgi:outer membrane protein TolC
MKKLLFLLCLVPAKAWTQVDSLTLEQCYQWTQEQYPLTVQKQLVQQVSQLNLKNVQSEFLPQVDLQAQATYQSDVTQIPIRLPEMAVPTLSKDQYRAIVQVQQLIYDGNAVEYRKKLLQSATAVEAQKLDVELYALKNRINSLYFALLMANEQQALL